MTLRMEVAREDLADLAGATWENDFHAGIVAD
jgi:hypothetical protein